MYRNLHNDIILTPPQDIATRPTRAHDAEDIQAAARPRPRVRRRTPIAAISMCVAATAGITIGSASANPRPKNPSSHVSARSLQREMRTLRAQGFVATSCRVDGTLMTNYSTNQSVLVKW
jgi:hypothetical protein